MPTLYVENVPEEVYRALRERAREHRKSISAEVLVLLEENVPTAGELARRKEFLERARRMRSMPSPASETLAAEASEILEAYAAGRMRLLVPDLFWPEVGNILWKAVRQGRMTSALAEEAIASLQERRIATAPTGPLLREAFAIATALERSVYDAVYVALAVVANRPLVTADERLANALAARYPVRWLGAV
jgi:predicted nucleic acid-binding protein